VNGFGPVATKVVSMGDDKKMSVAQYFKSEYKYTLKHPNLPTLHVGNPNNNILLPMELCIVKKQVRN
jgi:hypothetical protein